jgi:phosphonatase-like hydrolase
MTIELVVLDMAGTTVEEHGTVYEVLAEAVAAAGGRPTKDAVQRWMGADKREAITNLLGGEPDTATVDATYADFRARLDKAYRDRPPTALPGVVEALRGLRAAGVKVALTTGFDRAVTDRLLTALGWDDGSLIDVSICVDDVAAGRPAPYMIFHAMEAAGVHDVSRVLVAGDTVRDLQAGVNAGAGYVVGVLTGGLDATTLGAERHTHILPSVADLPALLAQGR